MDRNSLLAFLLIAVIIFLIPEYYKLVYPPPPDTDSLFVYKEEQIRAPLQPNENITTSLSFVKQEEAAKSFTINTNLYTAEISTINGGSIASLVLLNHALNDTESVDLIDNKNANNLLVRFRSIDGDDISLSGGWITDNDYDINVYENQTTVTFRKIVAEKQITKALTFTW